MIIVNYSGINEEGLDNLILDIYNYAEMCNKTFMNIQDLVSNTSLYYINDTGDSFRRKIDDMMVSFNDVNNKLLGYTNYLTNIKMKYQDVNVDVVKNISDGTDQIINYGKE